MRWAALRIVRFLWGATCRCSGWCIMICLSRQLSEVNFIRHENSGEWKRVFPGIVDDTQGAEYTL